MLISRVKYKDDVRAHGSGNAGTTNMLRVFGMRSGVFTFIGDFLKGVAAVLIGRLIAGDIGGYLASVGAVLGHDFPVFFGFKGGKGVAASFGSIIVIQPLIALIAAVTGFSVIYATRYVSLGSLLGFGCFCVLVLTLHGGDIPLVIYSALLLLLIIIRHTDNIKRLIRGEESKLFQRPQKRRNTKSDI